MAVGSGMNTIGRPVGRLCLFASLIKRALQFDQRQIVLFRNPLGSGSLFRHILTEAIPAIRNLLNIAGLGPIFGAIMGAQFGTASYLWIVLGTIFAGAVHDYFSGMLSIRHGGESLPEIVGRFLGGRTKNIFCVFAMILMVLVGAVFVSGPAELLAGMTPASLDFIFWMCIIFLYYVLATLMPVDKIIGRIYPLFAAALLFMAMGILVMLYVKLPELPEMWEGFGTKYDANPIFPMMFISIACGAISGFHATQSPLMARCMENEKHGRPIFYGAMVAEGK